jgi:hypothetical protein
LDGCVCVIFVEVLCCVGSRSASEGTFGGEEMGWDEAGWFSSRR